MVESLDSVLLTIHRAFDSYIWDATKIREEFPLVKTEKMIKFAELRVNGPFVQYRSGSTRFTMEVNILFTTIFDQVNPLFIRHLMHQGVDFLGSTPFLVPNIGCLQLTADPIKSVYFGFVDPKLSIQQGSAEASFILEV